MKCDPTEAIEKTFGSIITRVKTYPFSSILGRFGIHRGLISLP
jgi:hypothetical protein